MANNRMQFYCVFTTNVFTPIELNYKKRVDDWEYRHHSYNPVKKGWDYVFVKKTNNVAEDLVTYYKFQFKTGCYDNFITEKILKQCDYDLEKSIIHYGEFNKLIDEWQAEDEMETLTTQILEDHGFECIGGNEICTALCYYNHELDIVIEDEGNGIEESSFYHDTDLIKNVQELKEIIRKKKDEK